MRLLSELCFMLQWIVVKLKNILTDNIDVLCVYKYSNTAYIIKTTPMLLHGIVYVIKRRSDIDYLRSEMGWKDRYILCCKHRVTQYLCNIK